MTAGTGLLVLLPVTVAFLAATVTTGIRARRRAHLGFVACTVTALVLTIWFAVQLGKKFDLEAAGWITPVHLSLARVATFALLPTLVTGVLTWRGIVRRRVHRVFVLILLVLVVLAAVTGGWMLYLAEPI